MPLSETNWTVFHTSLPPFKRGVRLVSVARIVEEKGFEETLEVVKELTRRHIPVTWTLLGDGPLRAHILRLAASEGPERMVHWTGFDPQPERWLATSNLFILLSRPEAFGNAFVEANMMGLPTVGTAVGGIPEHLTDGINGILVPPGQVRVPVDAISALYHAPKHWRAMCWKAALGGSGFSVPSCLARSVRACCTHLRVPVRSVRASTTRWRAEVSTGCGEPKVACQRIHYICNRMRPSF